MNKVDMADLCELANELTNNECVEKSIKLEQEEANGDIRYTEEAQDMFNKYYGIIETILNV